MGSPGFFARAAPLIRNRGKLSTVFDRQTMKPLISEPPFVRALEDLRRLAADQSQLDLTPADIYSHILEGQVAIGMSWPGKHAKDENSPDATAPVGVVAVPGSEQWFDSQNQNWNLRPAEDSMHVDLIGFSGIVASVSRDSRNAEWAFRFLEWLSSKSISLITAAGSTRSGPFRASHLGDPTRWTGSGVTDEGARQYADLIRNCNKQTVVLMFPRIPGREEYLDVLDRNVRECLLGKLEPAAALSLVAGQWEEITEKIGRPGQIIQLRKDAGL